MEKTYITFGLFAIGLFMIYTGIMIRLGKQRGLFLGGGFPVLAPLGAFLVAIPLGLVVITIGLMMVFPQFSWTIPLGFFFFIFVILGFWMPDWIQPNWLRWLNKNYGHVLGEMFEEARKMGINEWEAQTRAQEGLERWADGVAKKHGWRRLR